MSDDPASSHWIAARLPQPRPEPRTALLIFAGLLALLGCFVLPGSTAQRAADELASVSLCSTLDDWTWVEPAEPQAALEHVAAGSLQVLEALALVVEDEAVGAAALIEGCHVRALSPP